MSWEEAVNANRNEEARKLFVDVYTDWCGWCKKMDKNTFSDPKVAEMLNEEFYPVKLDAEQKEPIIMGEDTLEFKPNKGRKGTHELALKLMNGKASYPTVVLLSEELQLIQPYRGYRKAGQIEAILAYFGGDHHRKGKDINKFIKEYEKRDTAKGSGEGKEEKEKEAKSAEDENGAKASKGKGSNTEKEDNAKKEHEGPIEWMSWEEMVEAQREDPKRVFIDIYTTWCGPCKILDKKTFQDEEVAEFINENFHAVKMDAEMKDTIRYKGNSYKNTKPGFEKKSKNSRGKPHELAATLVDGKLAYPTMVVLNEEMGRSKMFRGFRPPDELLEKLRPLVEDKSK